MEPIERFFKDNKDEFNYITPDADAWDQLENQLTETTPKKKVSLLTFWRKECYFLI